MKVDFPYQDIQGVDIPDDNLLGIFTAGNKTPEMNVEQIIKRAMENPIGMPLIRNTVKKTDRILIVSDDNTRATPAKDIVPFLMDELRAGGVKDENIKFLMALGTHRPMTVRELNSKLGEDIVKKYTVCMHESTNEKNLTRSCFSCQE